MPVSFMMYFLCATLCVLCVLRPCGKTTTEHKGHRGCTENLRFGQG
jgi:hypothetical protein